MRAILQLDAFTDRVFGGNPACVVPEADGLDARTMQAIAREMRCSETAFVLRPTRADCTERVRFFTPATEAPMCGHATIATYTALAASLLARGEGARVMECGAGALPIAIAREGAAVNVTMTQNAGWFADVQANALESVGLGADEAHDLPAEIASTGEPMAIVPVRARDALARCKADAGRIAELGVSGAYVVALERGRAAARYFGAEGSGIAEDPVTGAAAGALAAWLHRHGRLAVGDELVVEQGIEMGRPGVVRARMGGDGRPSITGSAVLVFASQINV